MQCHYGIVVEASKAISCLELPKGKEAFARLVYHDSLPGQIWAAVHAARQEEKWAWSKGRTGWGSCG